MADSVGSWPLGPEGDDDEEVSSAERDRRAKRRFSLAPLGKSIASLASNVGESLARTAAAAGELLTDAELRGRSAALLSESAKKAGAGVAKGLQQGAGRIAAGPRTVQGVLQKLQQRIEEQRLQALLREQQDAPVDVQVAFQLYEDAPQELRSRLWMAVLEHPELVHEYQTLAAELQRQRQQAAASHSPRSAGNNAAAHEEQPHEEQEAGSAQAEQVEEEGAAAAGAALGGAEAEATSEGQEQPHAGTEEEGRSTVGSEAQSAADPAHLSSSYSAAWAVHHVSASSASNGAAGSPRPGHAHLAAQQPGGAAEEDGWQLVSDQATAWKLQGGALLAGATEHPAYSRDREGFRNILMAAMMSVPWPLPSEYPPDCRYATLLQISLGQEDIDEVISRDLHRTFPEHPLFAFEQGQQALFNVLKAYALHDMEASYCQGMAFVAGLLLFYVPEEPAFQLFCRLLSTSGPNLRRLYLPGLEGLKAELSGVLPVPTAALQRFAFPKVPGKIAAAPWCQQLSKRLTKPSR
ncbi:hypothetical protein ABPG75_012435 [Micractinium tetrahymenae]